MWGAKVGSDWGILKISFGSWDETGLGTVNRRLPFCALCCASNSSSPESTWTNGDGAGAVGGVVSGRVRSTGVVDGNWECLLDMSLWIRLIVWLGVSSLRSPLFRDS